MLKFKCELIDKLPRDAVPREFYFDIPMGLRV